MEKQLTKAEEQLMQVLWDLEEASVKEIIEQLPKPKPAYNTVSTIIRILETKDFVAQHQSALVDAMVIIEDIDLAHLEAFYRCAEVFVYPSFAEGFGIPPLEAAIAQTKVVCSSATAMKDFDFFPYHIDPTDQDALDTAINEAIHDEDYDLQGLKNVVRDKYQWTNSAQILAEAIKATPKQQ